MARMRSKAPQRRLSQAEAYERQAAQQRWYADKHRANAAVVSQGSESLLEEATLCEAFAVQLDGLAEREREQENAQVAELRQELDGWVTS